MDPPPTCCKLATRLSSKCWGPWGVGEPLNAAPPGAIVSHRCARAPHRRAAPPWPSPRSPPGPAQATGTLCPSTYLGCWPAGALEAPGRDPARPRPLETRSDPAPPPVPATLSRPLDGSSPFCSPPPAATVQPAYSGPVSGMQAFSARGRMQVRPGASCGPSAPGRGAAWAPRDLLHTGPALAPLPQAPLERASARSGLATASGEHELCNGRGAGVSGPGVTATRSGAPPLAGAE